MYRQQELSDKEMHGFHQCAGYLELTVYAVELHNKHKVHSELGTFDNLRPKQSDQLFVIASL